MLLVSAAELVEEAESVHSQVLVSDGSAGAEEVGTPASLEDGTGGSVGSHGAGTVVVVHSVTVLPSL